MTPEEKKDYHKKYCKKYYQENKEIIDEQKKLYNHKNKERMKEQKKNYNQEHKEQQKKYREENKDKIRERKRKWFQENREKEQTRKKKYNEARKEQITVYCKTYNKEHKEQRKIYTEKHKEHKKLYDKDYVKQRRSTDPLYKLIHNVRIRVKKALQYKSKHTMDYIDCSAKFLAKHLESQFTDGMTWKNMGGKTGWQVDHILPIMWNNPTETEIIERLKWYNLQPLWAKDNIEKSNNAPTMKEVNKAINFYVKFIEIKEIEYMATQSASAQVEPSA